jgi:hypothetical protein
MSIRLTGVKKYGLNSDHSKVLTTHLSYLIKRLLQHALKPFMLAAEK